MWKEFLRNGVLTVENPDGLTQRYLQNGLLISLFLPQQGNRDPFYDADETVSDTCDSCGKCKETPLSNWVSSHLN